MSNFHDLPTTWIQTTLGDVSTLVQYGLNAKTNNDKEGIFYLRVSDIDNYGDVSLREPKYISSITENFENYLLQPGDAVIARSGSVGLGHVYLGSKKPWVFASYLIRFRLNQQLINPEYLAFYLRSLFYWRFIESMKRVVAQPNVNSKELSGLPIPLPLITEQRRIVEILREVDNLRRLRHEADEKTESVLLTVFNEMLGKPRDSWVERKLGDVIKYLQPGKSLNGSDRPAEEGKWGVLKVSAVTSGMFRSEENKELSEDEIPDKDLEVKDNDLLISRANTEELVGASAFVRNPPERLLLPDKLWKVVLPEEPEVNLLYLYALLNSPEMRIKISRAATGTSGSMKNISQENLLAIRFKMPPKNLQDELSDKIKVLWDDVSSIQHTAKLRLNLLSRTILSNAFTGYLTKEWREVNEAKLYTEASERNSHLRRATFAVRAEERAEAKEVSEILRTPVGRERYSENLSGQQRALLSLALKFTGYFDVSTIYNEQNGNGKLSRAAIEQSLALLAETGLLRRVRVKSYNSEDGREVFAPAIRTLKDKDMSRPADIGEIDSELNPA